MGDLHLAVDPGVLADHPRAGLFRTSAHIAADCAVDAQTAAEEHIALDPGGCADQAVDAVLGLACFSEHCGALLGSKRYALGRPGLRARAFEDERLHGAHLGDWN